MESINTRIIELSIKKRMKRMNLTALLLSGVCLLCHPLQAQQSVDACDGRTYKVGTRSVLANHSRKFRGKTGFPW